MVSVVFFNFSLHLCIVLFYFKYIHFRYYKRSNFVIQITCRCRLILVVVSIKFHCQPLLTVNISGSWFTFPSSAKFLKVKEFYRSYRSQNVSAIFYSRWQQCSPEHDRAQYSIARGNEDGSGCGLRRVGVIRGFPQRSQSRVEGLHHRLHHQLHLGFRGLRHHQLGSRPCAWLSLEETDSVLQLSTNCQLKILFLVKKIWIKNRQF